MQLFYSYLLAQNTSLILALARLLAANIISAELYSVRSIEASAGRQMRLLTGPGVFTKRHAGFQVQDMVAGCRWMVAAPATASDASSWKQGLVGVGAGCCVVVQQMHVVSAHDSATEADWLAAVSPLAQWLHRLQTCFSLIQSEE